MNPKRSSGQHTARDGVQTSHISPEMVMNGLIVSRSAVVVEGMVMGDIRCEQEVVVTASGTVVGSIVSRSATIEGRVEGNLFVYEKLRFLGGARMEGDVLTARLEVASMAAFNGNCRMSGIAEIEGIVRGIYGQPDAAQAARQVG